jgi:hypothetical protein
MATRLKVGALATAIAALLIYVAQLGGASAMDQVGLTPPAGGALVSASNTVGESLPLVGALPTDPSSGQEETVPPAASPSDALAVGSLQTVSTNTREASPEPIRSRVLLQRDSRLSAPRTLTSNVIERHFEFALTESTPVDAEKLFHVAEEVMWLRHRFSFREELDFVDRYARPVVTPFSAFDRTVVGEWTITIPNAHWEDAPNSHSLLLGRSPFENRVQQFRRHAYKDQLVVRFEEPDYRDKPEWFEGIESSMNFQMLRPPPGIAVGGGWNVPLMKVGPLTMPGGDLRLQFASSDKENRLNKGNNPAFRARFGDILKEAKIWLTYEGVDQFEGREHQQFTLAVNLAKDPPKSIPPGIPYMFADRQRIEWTVQIELEGAGRWDVNNGRLAQLEVNGEILLSYIPEEKRVLLGHSVAAVKTRSAVRFSMKAEDG